MLFYLFIIYQFFSYWINIAYLFFYSVIFDIQIIKIPDSPEKILYNRELERFQKYDKDNIKDNCDKNENIEGFYYDKNEYKKIFEDMNNNHELLWKRRILYMTTPMGNIAMHYDPFKLGFSYYADQSYVKYDILNAIAMKYVIMFRCWDFFMDESNIKNPSPLIKIHITEDVKLDPTKPNYNAILASKMNNSPFIKSKSINKENKENKKVESKIVEKEVNRNKFLYLGKIHNMKFTQPISKKRRLPVFQSALLDGVEKNASLQKECLSYKDYIKLQKAKKEE
jgi:hypothetical protein